MRKKLESRIFFGKNFLQWKNFATKKLKPGELRRASPHRRQALPCRASPAGDGPSGAAPPCRRRASPPPLARPATSPPPEPSRRASPPPPARPAVPPRRLPSAAVGPPPLHRSPWGRSSPRRSPGGAELPSAAAVSFAGERRQPQRSPRLDPEGERENEIEEEGSG